MFVYQPCTTFVVPPGLPGLGFDQNFDRAIGRYAEQAKAKKAAKLAHARIANASTSGGTNCKPNLITRCRAINGLQNEVKTEGKFEFADDYYWRLVSSQRD